MNPKLKNILIFGGIFILLVVGYIVFFGGNTQNTPALTTTGGTTGASTAVTSPTSQSAVGKEFLTTLLNLRNIKLDDSIFTNPAFASLQDFELSLIQETNPGRPNPFLPLGVDQSTATTGSTGSSQTGTTTGGPVSPQGTGTGTSTTPTTSPTPSTNQ
jgi:hypothetical protein